MIMLKLSVLALNQDTIVPEQMFMVILIPSLIIWDNLGFGGYVMCAVEGGFSYRGAKHLGEEINTQV